MIMADVLTWFLIIMGTYLVLLCYWLTSTALFPRVVKGCRQRYGQRPVVATLLGLGLLLPIYVLGVAAVRVMPHPVPANILKVILISPVLLGFLGSSGLALRIGEGLATDSGIAPPWRSVLRGGLVLAPTFLVPFFGWFVLLPWVLVSGFGVAVMTLSARSAHGMGAEPVYGSESSARVSAAP
jgi:hypothetical protein